MSGKAVGWVLDNSPYQNTSRLIHVVIADIANEENGNRLWASQQRIADKCKCDRKTVTRCMHQMVQDGYLRLIADNSARRLPNVYEFLTPLGTSHPEDEPTRDISSQSLGTSDPKLVMKCPSNVIELKEEQLKSISVSFEQFWAAYPRKVSKRTARGAFERAATRDHPETIVRGAMLWAKHWKTTGTEMVFIPHPSTWLNGDRWLDKTDSASAGSPLKGNAQLGKDFYGFEYENDEDLLTKLGAKVV